MAQKRKSKKRRTTAKKAKVYIPAHKIVIVCASVIAFCLFLLLISTFITQQSNKTDYEPQITSQFENPSENDAPKPEKKQEVAKTTPKQSEKKSTSSASSSIKQEQKSTQTTKKEEPKIVEKSVVVPTPKPQVEPEKPNAFFGFPQAKNGATLIFVFDDGGQNLTHLEKFMSIPFDFTVAVLPQLPHSKAAADRVRKSGNEVILHQPMQAINLNVNPGPGAITPNMDAKQITDTLFQNINQIGPISGMNNHEGSLITEDTEKMETIIKYVSSQGLYFLDSRTNVNTKVPYVCQGLGFSWYERNVFLDNTKNRQDILNEINKGINIANKTGSAIMIGHVWSADVLPALLKEIYPELKSKGYRFSTVSESNALKR